MMLKKLLFFVFENNKVYRLAYFRRSIKSLGNPVLEFFKYFHILTSLLTTNNNIFFILKNIFKTKIIT